MTDDLRAPDHAERTLHGAGAGDGNAEGTSKIARHDRPVLIAFATDAGTEVALREGLSEALGERLDIRRGGVRSAIAAMRKGNTPRTLIIDVSGEGQPLTALSSLADLLEPDVQVLVVGDRRDLDFYRQVTKGLGSIDYLPNPLTRDMVLRHFAPLVLGQDAPADATLGGRFVSVSGVRGGAGATTIAAYLAWHFAVDKRQHTALLDTDLHRGNAAMLLGVRVTGGLRTAMESPERVDELFIERTAQILDSSPASDRLSVLGSEERLADRLSYRPGAAKQLIRIMQRRYSVIVGDVPLQQDLHMVDFMDLAHRRILVMEPSLVSIRDALRVLSMASGGPSSRRPIVVMNRVGHPGALSQQQVADGLGIVPDVVINDASKQLGQAATLGLPQMALRGQFREAILELGRQAAFERLLDSPTSQKGTFWRRQTDPGSRDQTEIVLPQSKALLGRRS